MWSSDSAGQRLASSGNYVKTFFRPGGERCQVPGATMSSPDPAARIAEGLKDAEGSVAACSRLDTEGDDRQYGHADRFSGSEVKDMLHGLACLLDDLLDHCHHWCWW